MSEHSPFAYQPDTEPQPTWEHEALADALHTAADTVHDVAFGAGHRFHVGQERTVQLEVFPAAHAARITTSTARLELFRQEPPTTTSEGVIFTHASPEEMLQVHLHATGDVVLDRKSTRLNSSHANISYAVFC